MKKRITLILSVLCLCALIVALASCGHKHAYGSEWEKDDTNHWHKCDVEGEECSEYSEKSAHTYVETSSTAVSCTENGSLVETCSVCGYVKTTEISALGHDYTEVVINPTCTVAGKTVVTCKRDGCEYREEKNPVDIIAHTWIEASCASPKKCAYCTATEGEALEHEYVEEVVAPTCRAFGVTKVTCKNCDYYAEKDKQDKLPHTYNTENPVEDVDYRVTLEPTCVTTGEAYYICKSCNKAYTVETALYVLPMANHDEFRVEDVIPPTCDLDGRTEVTCSKGCNYYEEKDIVPATGHTYYMEDNAELGVHYNVTLDPTCTEKGERSYICTVEGCGKVATEANGKKEIAPLDHDWAVSVEPWCGNGGTYEYVCQRTCRDVKCTETKEELANEEYRHSYGEVLIPATCVDYGEYICSECNVAFTAYADGTVGLPTGVHNYNVVVEVIPSTCTTEGYTTYGCSAGKCNTTEDRDVTPLTSHTIVEISETGATSCEICNKSYVDITAVKDTGSDKVCFGCGKTPCECESTADWEGYRDPAAPSAINGETEFTSVGDIALSIGGGLIVLNGESTTTYTVAVYNGSELLYTFNVSGETALVDLYQYATVDKVVITASTDATVSFYKAI